MGSEEILVEQLFFVFLVFRYEMLNALLISIAAHVLGEVSVGFGIIFLVCLVNPRQKWILSNIIVAASCDLVQPL